MVKMARFAWREMSRIVGKRMEKFKESPRHIHVVACCPCSWPLGRKYERSRDKTQGHVCDEKSSSPPQTRLSFANVRCLAVCEGDEGSLHFLPTTQNASQAPVYTIAKLEVLSLSPGMHPYIPPVS